jgi:hypothetical protein
LKILTGVANIVGRELVLRENGILILRTGVLQVISTLGLNPVHNKEFKGKESGERDRELHCSSGSVPEDIRVGDLLSEDTGNTEHGPTAMNTFSLAARLDQEKER